MQGCGADGEGLGLFHLVGLLLCFQALETDHQESSLDCRRLGMWFSSRALGQHVQAYMHIQRLILELCVAQKLILEPVILVLGKQRQGEPILEVIQGYVARSCL